MILNIFWATVYFENLKVFLKPGCLVLVFLPAVVVVAASLIGSIGSLTLPREEGAALLESMDLIFYSALILTVLGLTISSLGLTIALVRRADELEARLMMTGNASTSRATDVLRRHRRGVFVVAFALMASLVQVRCRVGVRLCVSLCSVCVCVCVFVCVFLVVCGCRAILLTPSLLLLQFALSAAILEVNKNVEHWALAVFLGAVWEQLALWGAFIAIHPVFTKRVSCLSVFCCDAGDSSTSSSKSSTTGAGSADDSSWADSTDVSAVVDPGNASSSSAVELEEV